MVGNHKTRIRKGDQVRVIAGKHKGEEGEVITVLRNKNRVVSRADIAVNVWEIDFDTNTNVIDVYINYLRNKIDKPFPQKLIQTQVGMGYILKESAS